MRLYVNAKEVPYLKNALRNAIAQSESVVVKEQLTNLFERVALCEALQKSEHRAKNEEVTDDD